MKKVYSIILLMLFAMVLTACDFFDFQTEEIETTTESITTEEVTTWSSLESQLQNIYNLAIEADSFTGTYEEWLETVRGPKGDEGEAVQITVEGNYIKWKYESDVEWNELISLDDLRGDDAISIVSSSLNDNGELIITYSDDSEQNLGSIISRFQVTFYDFNGFYIDSVIVEYGDSVIPPSNPEREGYTFNSWSEDLTNIVCDLNVYAIYDVNTYTVTFDPNGGSLLGSEIVDVEYGETISYLPTPTRPDYIFAGWYKGLTVNFAQFTTDTQVKGDMILYAKWIEEIDDSELNNNIPNFGDEIVDDFDGEPIFSGMIHTEANEEDGIKETVDVAYKICTVKNDILQQLSPWVSASASEIAISTEKISSQTITAGLSVSLSTTVGVSAGIEGIVSASIETTWGFSASIEYAVTQAQSSSVSLTFPLDGYDKSVDYAVFLTGSYDVYQVFSTDILTGVVTDYIFVKINDSSVIRLLSSENANVNNNITISAYTIDSFSLDNFKIVGANEGTEENPYEIYNESDLYAMFFDPDKYYKLMDNIVITNFDGLNGVTFTGNFDGGGYSIENFDITVDPHQMEYETTYGFFPRMDGATVTNLIFNFPTFKLKYTENVTNAGDGRMYYGVLSGIATTSEIDNVIVKYGDIYNARYKSTLGGIVGKVDNSTITNSKVMFSTINSPGYTGGIVGVMYNLSTIDTCEFSGNADYPGNLLFYGTGGYAAYGGIIGKADNSTLSNLMITYTNLYFNGSFEYYPSVGYIVGEITNGTIYLITNDISHLRVQQPLSLTIGQKVEYNSTDRKTRYFKYENERFGWVHDN